MHERLKTLWRRCVRSFVQEAIKVMHIDTGMSVASLYSLATKVQIGKVVLARAMGERKRGPTLSYEGMPGVRKSIPFGQRLGENAGRVEFGSPLAPILQFQFDIVVFQHEYHENGLGGDVPWNSLEIGKEAFLATWHKDFPTILTEHDILVWLFGGA
jgi:hypothetical protein